MTQPTQHPLIQQQRKALQGFVRANDARATAESGIAGQAQQKQTAVEGEHNTWLKVSQTKLAETQALLKLTGTGQAVLQDMQLPAGLTAPNPSGRNPFAEFEQAVLGSVNLRGELNSAIANLERQREAEARRKREEEAEAQRKQAEAAAARLRLKKNLTAGGWITAGVALLAGLYYYPQYQQQQRQVAATAAAQAVQATATAAAQATQVALATVRQANPPRRISADRVALKLAQGVEVELIRIPAGEFSMGSDNALDDEKPQHRVTLPEYWIGKTEVTNAQFAAFVKATAYKTDAEVNNAQKQNHPVVNVSWNDALAFTRWVSSVTGQNVRLPSEAEWEKAACGTDGRIYPWGNAAPDRNRVNFADNVKTTVPVGQYGASGASPYGLDDMAGNVWEWTNSVYKSYPYNPNDGRENLLGTGGRVIRGGAYNYNDFYLRCASRLSYYYPTIRLNDVGFRILASPIS
jgi:formylglycine-generating enzyme required for sulfatase activity